MILSLEKDRENHSVIRHYLGMSLNEMRHLEISRFIEHHNITRIMDLGCCEGALIQRLARSSTIELLVGVDIDETATSHAVMNTYPQNIQQSIQYSRKHDQKIFIYHGDASQHCLLLKQFQVELVSFLEVIEHLQKETIDMMIENIFGFIRPKFCFLSTPNKEFNIHFDMQENQMRHWDHKFQWTRNEFKQFCNKIEEQYGYIFQIKGIGEHISDQSKGEATQYAVFTLPQNKQLPFDLKTESSPKQLQLKAEYENKSWHTNMNRIMQSILYKILYNDNQSTWINAIQFLQKDQFGQCLNSEKIIINKELFLKYLEIFNQNFEWNEESYWIKRQYSDSDHQNYEEINQISQQ